MVSLNQAIGFPPTTVLSLEDEFSYERTEGLDLDAEIEYALANRIEIAPAKSALDIADMNMKLADNTFTRRLNHDRAKTSAADARSRL